MKLTGNTNTLLKTGAAELGGVAMSLSKGKENMFAMYLRKNIYSDPILAVVREYAANAVDEHTKHGINRPVELSFTRNENQLYFSIRDFAKGLDQKGVEFLGQYGETTKDKNNDEIGGFGVGAKCGHAYTSSFVVISRHNGTRSYYSFILDGEGADATGRVIPLGSTPMEEGEETGLEIQVPLMQESDRSEFIDRTRRFLPFCLGRITLEECGSKLYEEEGSRDYLNDKKLDKKGKIISFRHPALSRNSVYLVMGFIPYSLDHSFSNKCRDLALERVLPQVGDENVANQRKVLKNALSTSNTCLFLRAPIGTLEPALSREDVTIDSAAEISVSRIYEAFFRDKLAAKEEFLGLFKKESDYLKHDTAPLNNPAYIVERELFKGELIDKADKALLFSKRFSNIEECGDVRLMVDSISAAKSDTAKAMNFGTSSFRVSNGNLIRSNGDKFWASRFVNDIPRPNKQSSYNNSCSYAFHHTYDTSENPTLHLFVDFDETMPASNIRINEHLMFAITEFFEAKKIEKTEKNLNRLHIHAFFRGRAKSKLYNLFKKDHQWDYANGTTISMASLDAAAKDNEDGLESLYETILNESKRFISVQKRSSHTTLGENSDRINRTDFFADFSIENSISIKNSYIHLNKVVNDDGSSDLFLTPVEEIPKNATVATLSGVRNDIVNLDCDGNVPTKSIMGADYDLECSKPSIDSEYRGLDLNDVVAVQNSLDWDKPFIITVRAKLKSKGLVFQDVITAIEGITPSLIKKDTVFAGITGLKEYRKNSTQFNNIMDSCYSVYTGTEEALNEYEDCSLVKEFDELARGLRISEYIYMHAPQKVQDKMAKMSNATAEAKLNELKEKFKKLKKECPVCDAFLNILALYDLDKNQMRSLATKIQNQYNEYNR